MTGEELYGLWAEEAEDHPTDLGAIPWSEVPGDEKAAWNQLAARVEVTS